MTTRDPRDFLSRWSRRKLEAAQPRAPDSAGAVSESPQSGPPPELPPIDQLTPESDFSGFMHAKVDASLRRAALKTLFKDPRFNIQDGLDDWNEDYTLLENLAPGVAETLQHARSTLFGPAEESAAQTQVPTDEPAAPETGELAGPTESADEASPPAEAERAATRADAPSAPVADAGADDPSPPDSIKRST